MEETYSYDQRYTPWNPPPYQHHAPQYNAYQSNEFDDAYYGYEDPPPPYPPFQTGIEEAFQLLWQERKELQENQRRINAQVTTLQLKGREDAPLNEEDVENLNHKEVHECLEEVEEENEDQEAEDVDHKVEDKDKEPKGMEIVHSASSEATPSKLPSELQFEWVNFSNLNFIGPQHYALLETDDQLRALCGVLDKKEMDSLGMDESRFITCEKLEFKAYSGHLHKFHNNRAKVEAFSLRKHLGPWQFQQKLVDSQNNGGTNQVWDPEESYKNQHFLGVVTYLGIVASFMYMIWNPIKNKKSKYWWKFIDSVRILRSLVHTMWDLGDQCNNKNWWKFQDEFKHKPP
ncbi:hypothetical protein PIB30_069485 [Stylosanthes scabra]|uniref:Uncharacterized protein n=1 Tax=Stylosanthes scabra TaxID=79078 RepID=A0ABU6ZLW1_9FABA|nr:hypothetical protein [Stylosanthes scabra]